jgi:hypothetical protein
MKKLFLTFILILASIFSVSAQDRYEDKCYKFDNCHDNRRSSRRYEGRQRSGIYEYRRRSSMHAIVYPRHGIYRGCRVALRLGINGRWEVAYATCPRRDYRY